MGHSVDLKRTLAELFDASQRISSTSTLHQKNRIIMKNIYDRNQHDAFFGALKQQINAILVTEFTSQNIYAERSIDFLAEFCALFKPICDGDDVLEHRLLTDIFDYLLVTSECEQDVVRFRSCQIINKILDHLAGSEVSSDLCDKLKEFMWVRLEDPKTAIRLQAIISLYRLQDPSDPEDDIISNFVSMINTDSSAKVRQLCTERVAVCKDVISSIITKIRDVDMGVRLAGYKRLSKFANYLKNSDKRLVLKCGASDSCVKVKEFVKSNLIKAWLEQYDENILELMKSVRIITCEKDIKETVKHYEFILTAIFSQKNLKSLSEVLTFDKDKLLPLGDLSWETASYWAIYMRHLFDNDIEEELQVIQPEFVDLCRYIKRFYNYIPFDLTTEEFLENQFIIKQFFLMTKTYDLADPARRQFLNCLIRDILQNVELMTDVTQTIVSNLEYTISNMSSRCSFVSEIISEIKYPTHCEEAQKKEEERELTLSKLKLKLSCLMDEQNKAIQNEQYLEADRLKYEIEETKVILNDLKNAISEPIQAEKRTDIPTVIKYLDIAYCLLLSYEITELIPTLVSLKKEIILELLIHDNDTIRAKALHCYCLCCLVDKTDARTGIHIFSTPILAYSSGEECDTQTLLVCIAAIVDLLRIYGSNLLAEPSDDPFDSMDEGQRGIFMGGTSLTDLIRGLAELLNDEEYEIQLTAGLGLCKLILSERIQSSGIVARLILKWCLPIDDETNGLKQIIGFTLQQITTLPTGADQLEDAVPIVIKTLVFAPKDSPLADVNIENIAKFMLALCKSTPQGGKIHKNLAIKICSEMTDCKKKLNIIYSKMLLMLETDDDPVALKDILNLCDNIRDNVSDKYVFKNVVKFQAKINERNDRIGSIAEEESIDVDKLSENGRGS